MVLQSCLKRRSITNALLFLVSLPYPPTLEALKPSLKCVPSSSDFCPTTSLRVLPSNVELAHEHFGLNEKDRAA
jgi:hypothetical protein